MSSVYILASMHFRCSQLNHGRFNPPSDFCWCFIVDFLVQHKCFFLNLCGRCWRTCKMNWITPTPWIWIGTQLKWQQLCAKGWLNLTHNIRLWFIQTIILNTHMLVALGSFMPLLMFVMAYYRGSGMSFNLDMIMWNIRFRISVFTITIAWTLFWLVGWMTWRTSLRMTLFCKFILIINVTNVLLLLWVGKSMECTWKIFATKSGKIRSGF